MASAIDSTLPIVITTRFNISQGKTITVQDFLRGLKRPGSKAQSAKTPLISSNQDGPLLGTLKNDDLPDPAPLAEDGPTSTPITNLRADNTSIPGPHETSSIKPPKSDAPQSLCSSPSAKSAGSPEEPAVTGLTRSLDTPKVIRTYGRKSKPELPPTEDLPDSSSLFCTQCSTADQGQIPKNLEATSWVQELENLVHHDIQNDQQRALRVGPPTVEAVVKEPCRKRKNRRAPVNELALVAELPLHANSPGRESSPQGRAKSKSSNEANIGRLMTKFRRDRVIPRRNSIDPQDFKFPPITPKSARSSGWTPGSGFEGTTFQTSGPTTLTSHRRPARRVKAIRFAVPSLRPLHLSNEMSPIAKASNSPLLQKAPKSLALAPEATRRLRSPNPSQDPSTDYGELISHIDKATPAGETMSSHIQTLTALLRPCAEINQPAKFENFENDDLSRRYSPSRRKCPSPQKRGADSPAIRRPSKSERNGWLKRRRRVSFADENEQRTPQTAKISRQSDENGDTEQLFEAHNATWYGKDAQADPCFQERMQGQGSPISMIRPPQFQATRSSQSLTVQHSHGQSEAESLELGNYPNYPVQDSSLNAGKYFSNAIQKLSSQEKEPHTIARRKPQIQKLGYGRQSEMEGNLELSITPRLKRTLSSVPFRPPFKSL